MSVWSGTSCFVDLGLRRAWRERFVIVIPMVTYTLLITIFASVFQVTPLEELPDAIRVGVPELIWYLALTESITFGGGYTFPEVRAEVLDGLFMASLTRPLSYFRIKLWNWVGQTPPRVLAFLVLGGMLTRWLAGSFADWRTIPLMLLSVGLGALIHGIIYFSLALLEVWGPYARPAMWISQKLCFLLGGLLLPITFYPHWLQTLAWMTPYPAVLNIPGRLAFHPPASEILAGLLTQVGWLAAVIALAYMVQYLATRKILALGS